MCNTMCKDITARCFLHETPFLSHSGFFVLLTAVIIHELVKLQTLAFTGVVFCVPVPPGTVNCPQIMPSMQF